MWYIFWILHYALPNSVFYLKFCYIHPLFRGDSSAASELYLSFYWYVCAYYNGVFILMFVNVIQYNFWLYFILVFCSISLLRIGYSTTASFLYLRLYWYVCASYNGVFVLCLCMLHNLIVGYTSSWYFVLYLYYAWVIPPLHNCYMCVYINMFVNVIPMVTAICFGTS